jgi:hypothetical protein
MDASSIWHNGPANLTRRNYVCGHCGKDAGTTEGYFAIPKGGSGAPSGDYIYICSICRKPTFFGVDGEVVPGPKEGADVAHLPADVAAIYAEARKCATAGGPTGAVSLLRVLIVHIADEEGALKKLNIDARDLTFKTALEYLADNGFVPPKGKEWVQHIIEMGHKVNHRLAIMQNADATALMKFAEMLLRFLYEMPKELELRKQPGKP